MMLYQRYGMLDADAALRELGSSLQGLPAVEALRRRAAMGSNEVRSNTVHWFDVLRRQVVTVLSGLLLAAAVVALILREPVDAITILVILVLNTALGFVQEYRSERALETLTTYLTGSARVRRGGAILTISRSEVVPGDVVLLQSGDAVPADCRILHGTRLLADESTLTGESEPAHKDAAPPDGLPHTPADASSVLFAGTLLATGEADALVFATSRDTEFGRIAAVAGAIHRKSAFEDNVRSFSRFIAGLVAATLAILFIAKIAIDGSTDRAGELLLFSLALAISVVPEALPVVMTITFSRGALHLARRKVVVRRLSAIEDLGHIEVLCTDKTGTITENRMQVADIFATDQERVLRAAAECSARPAPGELPANPFDRAIWNRIAPAFAAALITQPILGEIPFDHVRRRNAVVIPATGPDGARLVVRGAPEEVLMRSAHHGGQALTIARREEILRTFAAYGRKGFRVLALAERQIVASGPWRDADEKDLEWIGLIAFEDPLKPTAKAAVALAERLKVRVKILTGDGREVAGAVARDIGIIPADDRVITGAELDTLDAEAFRRTVEEFDVFARVTPDQKYRIIDALQHTHAVGFLGEGVNDAPALKLADVALAVDTAADASKAAADAVILDRSLLVIISGIREGRAMVSNVAKYIRYSLAGNFGNFISIATISLFLPYLPMLPVQVLLTNLLTDLPLITLAADRVDTTELGKPRRLNVRDIVFSAMILGLVSAVFDLIFFFLYRQDTPARLQTIWFIFSVLAELATIFVVRTALPILRAARPSRTLVWSTVAAAGVSLALLYVPQSQAAFHFAVPTPRDLGIVAVLVVGVVVMSEAVKLSLRRHFRSD